MRAAFARNEHISVSAQCTLRELPCMADNLSHLLSWLFHGANRTAHEAAANKMWRQTGVRDVPVRTFGILARLCTIRTTPAFADFGGFMVIQRLSGDSSRGT